MKDLSLPPLPDFPFDSGSNVTDRLIEAVTVDVFDTILLRKPISEVRRHTWIANEVLERLNRGGFGAGLTAEIIRWTRRKAEQLAFRAREVHGDRGEVQFSDIVRRQCTLLSLPETAQSAFLEAESAVEKRCLYPNQALIDWLRAVKRSGRRIFAISDTTLSKSSLVDLIASIGGEIHFDDIYSSADTQATKRDGSLYDRVIQDHNLDPQTSWHLGDNLRADVDQAATVGLATTHLPRSKSYVFRRKADGAFLLADRFFTKRAPLARNPLKQSGDIEASKAAFGEHVIGPLVLEYALQTWMYLDEIDEPDQSVALFCSRGGLLMRLAYETVVERLDLDAKVATRDVMISRLVASRLVLEQNGPFVAKEIAREFRGETVSSALNTVSGEDLNLGPEWDIGLDEPALRRFLESDASTDFRAALNKQNTLFRHHLADVTGSASHRIVLVDTGLFGTTLRLMQEAQPDVLWESVMLARSNYKGFPEDHFAQAIGLWTERNQYQFSEPRSAILRFWQLIEAVFEPELESVVAFSEVDGKVVSNLEVEGWRQDLLQNASPFFKGVMAYLQRITPETLPQSLMDIESNWRRLKKTIVFPSADEARILAIGARSRDYGRTQAIEDGKRANFGGLWSNVSEVRTALWKSGAITRLYPVNGGLIKFGQELHYISRSFRSLFKK